MIGEAHSNTHKRNGNLQYDTAGIGGERQRGDIVNVGALGD